MLFLIVSISNAQVDTLLKVTIAGKTNGEITREELLDSKGLVIENKPEGVNGISSFRITIVEKGNVLGPADFNNPDNGELTDKMREAIKNVAAGSKIYFEYIKCTLKDGARLSLHPLNFVLK